MDTYNFAGKRALVTGAGKGIGRGIAIQLAKLGAKVFAISRTQSDLDSLKVEEPSIETLFVDIADWDNTRVVVESVGTIDLLVNNAGVLNPATFLEATKDEFDNQMNINYRAAFNISQVAGLAMSAAGIYVRFTKTEYDALLGASMIPVASYVMIGGGALVTFLSVAGFGGALCDNRKVLVVYITCLAFVFLVQCAAGVLGFMYYEQMRTLLDEHVQMAIIEKYGYEEYNIISEGVNFMQQELDCCGYLEPTDWTLSKYYKDPATSSDRGSTKVPISCCKDMLVIGCNNNFDTKLHSEGCVTKLEALLKSNLLLIGVASVSVAMVQIIACLMAVVLCKKTEDYVVDF